MDTKNVYAKVDLQTFKELIESYELKKTYERWYFDEVKKVEELEKKLSELTSESYNIKQGEENE